MSNQHIAIAKENAMSQQFPKLSTKASKCDEIAHLEAVAASVEPGTYLANLFSKDMVNWVSEQIRNDFPADLYDWYKQAGVDGRETEQRLREANQTIECDGREHEKQVLHMTGMAELAQSKIDHLTGHAKALRGDYNEAWNTSNNLREDVRELEDAIVRLKAEVYDLTHSKGN